MIIVFLLEKLEDDDMEVALDDLKSLNSTGSIGTPTKFCIAIEHNLFIGFLYV